VLEICNPKERPSSVSPNSKIYFANPILLIFTLAEKANAVDEDESKISSARIPVSIRLVASVMKVGSVEKTCPAFGMHDVQMVSGVTITLKSETCCKFSTILFVDPFVNARTQLCTLWKDIFKTYARINEILLDRWQRVCYITGKLVHAKRATDMQNKTFTLAGPLDNFHKITNLQFYDTYFKSFRKHYYACEDENMSVINGEFDVFSLGKLILNHYRDKNTEIKNIILTKNFSKKYEKLPCQRLTETAEAIQRLEVLFFDLT